jgi:parallel beta-helix repeat protein
VWNSSNLDIDANNASNNAVTGIALLTSSGIDVTRNTVNSNPGNTDYPGGITIAASCSNIAVTNNFIETNTFGVWVKDTAGAGITVHANSIVGNTTAGVQNNSTNVVDATCNWWGAANGPGPVGPGSGDKVSAGVTFLPWLITSDLNGPCIGGLTFTVDASVTGGHGSVTPANQTVECPDSATINISPDTGYHIASITDNGNPAAIANPYVISNVTANHTVVVTFAIDTFDVNASVIGGHGSVSPATQTVDWNTSASISISPDLGYHIASITDNGNLATIANPYVISNVTVNHTVVVTFAPTVPETKEKCKNDGWISVRRADGSPFKNQGDCIQYVNTGK